MASANTDDLSYPQTGLQQPDELIAMLFHQAEAIWPQESQYIKKYREGKTGEFRVLDVGCGTGEFCLRVAKLYPEAVVVGVDLVESSIEVCNSRIVNTDLAKRVSFQVGNAYDLSNLADHSFDIVACRSVLHAIKEPERVIKQMARLAKKDGILHMLNEDYAMIYAYPTKFDVREISNVCVSFLNNTGTNGLFGRMSYNITLHNAHPSKIDINTILVDTIKVQRSTVAKIWETWRDGYSQILSDHSGVPKDQIIAMWNDLIDCTKREDGYACWQIIVCSAFM